jgi:branched-chain amino acid transport system substrate-binding protein
MLTRSLLLCAALVSFSANPVAAEAIRIGISAALSGIQSTTGKDVSGHAAAAIADLNATGGFGRHKAELLVIDDGYLPERTAANVETLTKDKRVHLVTNLIGSAHINAALPHLKSAGVTLFAPLSGPSSIYAAAMRPTVVPLRGSYWDEVREQVRLLTSMGVASVSLLYQDDDFGRDVLKAWKDAGDGSPRIVSVVPVARGQAEVETMVDEALRLKPGAVVMALVPSAAARAVKRVKATSGNAVYSVLTSASINSDVIDDLKGTGRGTILFSSVVPVLAGGSSQFLLDYTKFRKRHNLPASLRGLETYLTMQIVAEAVKRQAAPTAQSLGAALSEAQRFVVSDLVVRAKEPRYAEVFVISKSGAL